MVLDDGTEVEGYSRAELGDLGGPQYDDTVRRALENRQYFRSLPMTPVRPGGMSAVVAATLEVGLRRPGGGGEVARRLGTTRMAGLAAMIRRNLDVMAGLPRDEYEATLDNVLVLVLPSNLNDDDFADSDPSAEALRAKFAERYDAHATPGAEHHIVAVTTDPRGVVAACYVERAWPWGRFMPDAAYDSEDQADRLIGPIGDGATTFHLPPEPAAVPTPDETQAKASWKAVVENPRRRPIHAGHDARLRRARRRMADGCRLPQRHDGDRQHARAGVLIAGRIWYDPPMRTIRRDLSLVEVLVVIGVIALLIGILLPVLGRARSAGQATTCLSNLRQVATLAAGFAAEHDQTLPLDGEFHLPDGTAGYGSLPPALDDAQRRRYAYLRPDPPDYYLPTEEYPVPFHVALAVRALDLDDAAQLGDGYQWHTNVRPRHGGLDLFYCPSHEVRPLPPTTSVDWSSMFIVLDNIHWHQPIFTSITYNANGGLLGFHHDAAYAHRLYAGRLPRVRGASTLVLTGETNLRTSHAIIPMHDQPTRRLPLSAANDGLPEFRWGAHDEPRHGKTMNFAFVDGHAEAVVPGSDGPMLLDE